MPARGNGGFPPISAFAAQPRVTGRALSASGQDSRPRGRIRTALARKLIVPYRPAREAEVGETRRFGRCIIIDDDPDILLSARLLLRDLFREVADFQDPAEALKAMDEELPDVILLDANFGRGATNAAEGFHWLGRDPAPRSARGGGDDHRPCRDQRRGRRDEARRDRFRLQALVERAAARHRPHRRGAAQLARRGGDRAQARRRRRRARRARRRCSAVRRRWRGWNR